MDGKTKLKRKIYEYDKKIDTAFKRLKATKSVSKRNKKLINEFIVFVKAEGVSEGRYMKTIQTMTTLGELISCDFDKATRKEIEKLVAKSSEQGYSAWFRHDLITFLKKFYKWLKQSDTAPPIVSWIKKKTPENTISDRDLITDNEARDMVNASLNLRDKAIIGVLFETGMRPSELLMLTRDCVSEPRNDALILEIKQGKTKYSKRKLLVQEFAKELKDWLKASPAKNQDDLLFVGINQTNKNEPLSIRSLGQVLTRASKYAKIDRRVFPYLIRHSRLTAWYNNPEITAQQAKVLAGHSPDSRQARAYDHTSNDQALKPLWDAYYTKHGKQGQKEDLYRLLITPKTIPLLVEQAVKDGKKKDLEIVAKSLGTLFGNRLDRGSTRKCTRKKKR